MRVLAKESLHGYLGRRLPFGVDWQSLLRFQGRVKPVAVGRVRPAAPRKLIDQHHLALRDDVVHSAPQEQMGAHGLLDLARQGPVTRDAPVQPLLHSAPACDVGAGIGPDPLTGGFEPARVEGGPQAGLHEAVSPLGRDDRRIVRVQPVVELIDLSRIAELYRVRGVGADASGGPRFLGRQAGDVLVVRVGHEQRGQHPALLASVWQRLGGACQPFRYPVLQGRHLSHDSVRGVDRAAAGRPAPRDDQRRRRLVDQDLVCLVDYCRVEPALHPLPVRVAHIVAQEIEAKLPHRAVNDVGSVSASPLVVVHVLQHDPDSNPQRLVDRGEMLGVPQCQVVVRRDHVHTPALHCVSDGREDGGDGLPLSRVHLDDAPPPHVQPGEDLLVRGRECERVGHRGVFDRLVEAGGELDVPRVLAAQPLHD